MKDSFCAAVARQTGEDPIGTAGHYQTYVLIECPYPWAAKALESDLIPDGLKQFISEVQAQRSVRFLLVNQGRSARQRVGATTRVLIYDSLHLLNRQQTSVDTERLPKKTLRKEALQQKEALQKEMLHKERGGSWFGGYRGFEFQLDGLGQVADCLRAYWQGSHLGQPITQFKDVLVCTHGMRDRCCARFGQPFFRAAQKMVKAESLSSVRIWRVSHIGGHRFAPTVIVLPEGRYYARLTVAALRSVLTRCGSTEDLSHILQEMYRGWGLLPQALQVLERQFIDQFGWDWLRYRLSYCVLEAGEEATLAVLWMQSPAGTLMTYRAEVRRSHHPAHEINTACNVGCPFIPVQYSIAELTLVNHYQPAKVATAVNR